MLERKITEIHYHRITEIRNEHSHLPPARLHRLEVLLSLCVLLPLPQDRHHHRTLGAAHAHSTGAQSKVESRRAHLRKCQQLLSEEDQPPLAAA